MMLEVAFVNRPGEYMSESKRTQQKSPKMPMSTYCGGVNTMNGYRIHQKTSTSHKLYTSPVEFLDSEIRISQEKWRQSRPVRGGRRLERISSSHGGESLSDKLLESSRLSPQDSHTPFNFEPRSDENSRRELRGVT